MTMTGALELAKVPQRTYVTDGGRAVLSPQLPAPPSGPGLTVVLRAQEIRTLRCTLAYGGEDHAVARRGAARRGAARRGGTPQ